MVITPTSPSCIKGSSSSFTVSQIKGTLSVTEDNLYITGLTFSQSGDSATVFFNVSSAAVTTSGNITVTDEGGSTVVTVQFTANTWNSTLTGEDVFARQQQLADNQSRLLAELNNLQLLVSVSLAAQVGSLAATLTNVNIRLTTIENDIDALARGNLIFIG